jgi:hypothetical protein
MFKAKFTVDPGSSSDLAKLMRLSRRIEKDLPEGHSGPRIMRTIVRRIRAGAKLLPIEGDGKGD